MHTNPLPYQCECVHSRKMLARLAWHLDAAREDVDQSSLHLHADSVVGQQLAVNVPAALAAHRAHAH